MANITDLCKQCLQKIVQSEDPNTLIYDAIREANLKPPVWKNHFGLDKFWDEVTSERGWRIMSQENIKRRYTIADPNNGNRADFYEADFKIFLEKILEKFVDYGSNMEVFQIVSGKNVAARKGCIVIKLSEAEQKYPNTKNLTAGFYTNHPADEKALTPIENYYTNLAINQDDERVVLLGKMGAKSVEIERINIVKKENELKGNANISVVKAEIGSSLAGYFRDSTHLKVEF